MLALAGGAAMMGRRKASVANTAASEDANINTNAPILGTDHIIKKAPVDNVAAVDTGPKRIINRTRGKVFYSDGTSDTAGTIYQKNKLTAGNQVPPSMRSGAAHAEGYQRRIPGQRHFPGGWEGGYSMRAKGGRIGAKKGGRVTGIAKRGFGRALMKGKK